jgi:hypothetical protein
MQDMALPTRKRRMVQDHKGKDTDTDSDSEVRQKFTNVIYRNTNILIDLLVTLTQILTAVNNKVYKIADAPKAKPRLKKVVSTKDSNNKPDNSNDVNDLLIGYFIQVTLSITVYQFIVEQAKICIAV